MLPIQKHYATPEQEQAARLRAEARDPATPPMRLREMALDLRPEGRRVREALASNPSTPPEALAKLLWDVPAAFCRNPVAPLLPLEVPEFVEKLTAGSVRRMLGSARAPLPLVAQATIGNPKWPSDVAEAARLHVTQGVEVPDAGWADRVRGYWQEYMRPVSSKISAAADPVFGGGRTVGVEQRRRHELLELTELTTVPKWMVCAAGEDDPLADADYAGFLRRAGSRSAVRDMERAHKEPPLGEPVQNLRSAGDRLLSFVAAAFSRSIPSSFLEAWSEHHPWYALAAAQNPNASPELLLKLVRHEDPAVRRAALRHPATPAGAREICRLLLFRRAFDTGNPFHNHYWQQSLPEAPWLLVRFMAMLEAPETVRRPLWHRLGHSPLWQDRLGVAVSIGPRPSGKPPRPRHLVLLQHLSQDGNLLVRASARARLRGETFRFE